MADPAEIGRVTWGDGLVAVLRDDGTWDVPDFPVPGRPSLLAEALTHLYAAAWRDHGPADGWPGVPQLHDWAARVDGEVTLADRPSSSPGTVY